jgi:hypothetical protein
VDVADEVGSGRGVIGRSHGEAGVAGVGDELLDIGRGDIGFDVTRAFSGIAMTSALVSSKASAPDRSSCWSVWRRPSSLNSPISAATEWQ